MSPISGSNLLTAAAYDVAVAKKALASSKEQGQQALALIQAATPAPAQRGDLGQLVNVRA